MALEAGQKATAGGVVTYVSRVRQANPDVDIQNLIRAVIRSHLMLARAEGAAAGVATTTAEATTVIGTAGTLTLPTAVVITAMDLTGLAWIQLRMALMIAALCGHDPTDPARIREFTLLQGALPATAMPAAAKPLTAAAGRITTRLLKRYLRGPFLQSITALFRIVGIRFSRAVLLRQIFLLNIPINVMINDAATRRLAHKAQAFYSTLPAPEPIDS